MKSKVVLNFVNSINCADLGSLIDLMAEDHVFIDSQDNKMAGKENLKLAWIGYFELFPDYKIEVNEIIENGSLLCILGYASGTYKNIKDEKNRYHWRIPAAWSAIVDDNKIKKWQVYADNSVVIDIINRTKRQEI